MIKEDFAKIHSYRWTCHSGRHGYPNQLEAEVCCDGNLRPFVKQALIAELDKPLHFIASKNHETMKICGECLNGNGHPFVYCSKCPGKAVEVRNLGYTPTVREYLNKSTSLQVFNERADMIYSHLKHINHSGCWDRDQPVRWWDEEWLPYTVEEKEALNISAVNYEKYCRLGAVFLREYLEFKR